MPLQVIIVEGGEDCGPGTPEELKNKAGSGIALEVWRAGGPGEEPGVINAIAGVETVEVTQAGPISRLLVKGKTTAEVREQMVSTIVQRGWNLREMRQTGASLEEFFVRITDPAAAAGVTPFGTTEDTESSRDDDVTRSHEDDEDTKDHEEEDF